MSNTNIEISNYWVWNSGWEVPSESLFSALLKLSWINSAQAQELLDRIFHSTMRKSQNLEIHPRSFIDTSWTEQFIPKNVPDWVHQLVQVSNCYSSQTLRCLYSDRAIRYCKKCLARGIHFPEFQMENLRCCPLHKLPLLEICESCAMPTSRYALCKETFESPFFCHHCGAAYAGIISASNFFVSDIEKNSINDAIKPIADWVSHISSKNFRWMEKEACLLTELDVDPTYSRRMMFSQAVQSAIPVTNEVLKLFNYFPNWQTWIVPVPPKSKNYWFDLIDTELIEQRRKIYKSIRRHLFKKHVRLHKSCMETASTGGFFGHLNLRCLPNAHCCIWAQTWMFWRSRFEDMYLAKDLWKGHRLFDDQFWKSMGGIDDAFISNQEWSVKVLLVFHGAFRLIRSWVTSRWKQASLSAKGCEAFEFEIVAAPHLQVMFATEKNIEVHFARIISSIESFDSSNCHLLVGANESNQFKKFRCICNPYMPRNS